MGYTHYWERVGKSPKEWKKLTSDCRKLVERLGIPLANGHGDPGSAPEVSDLRVCFNGVEEQSHETFCLSINKLGFQFCKTAYKPYDMAVMCCLVVAKHYFPSMRVSSDGSESNWAPAVARVKEILGYTPKFYLGEDVPVQPRAIEEDESI